MSHFRKPAEKAPRPAAEACAECKEFAVAATAHRAQAAATAAAEPGFQSAGNHGAKTATVGQQLLAPVPKVSPMSALRRAGDVR